MRKFIKGTFLLKENVTDIESFEAEHNIKKFIDFANTQDFEIAFGTSDDNSYLCEYKIVGNTLTYCRSILSCLKVSLKQEFPKMESIWQGNGDIIF